jgi:hypothetical protein
MGIADTRIAIYGLQGQDDVALLEDALRCLPGVVHVAIDSAAGQAHIWYDPDQLRPGLLAAAGEHAGYPGLVSPADAGYRRAGMRGSSAPRAAARGRNRLC